MCQKISGFGDSDTLNTKSTGSGGEARCTMQSNEKTRNETFSTYSIVRKYFKQEASYNAGDSYKQVYHNQKNVGCAGLLEEK